MKWASWFLAEISQSFDGEWDEQRWFNFKWSSDQTPWIFMEASVKTNWHSAAHQLRCGASCSSPFPPLSYSNAHILPSVILNMNMKWCIISASWLTFPSLKKNCDDPIFQVKLWQPAPVFISQSVMPWGTYDNVFRRCPAGETDDITWHQDCDSGLHSFADDVVQGEHPVRLDVVVSQHFVYLEIWRFLIVRSMHLLYFSCCIHVKLLAYFFIYVGFTKHFTLKTWITLLFYSELYYILLLFHHSCN